MNAHVQPPIPIIEDQSQERSLPPGDIFVPKKPGHFKNRYTNSEWSKQIADIMHSGAVLACRTASRTRLVETCKSFPTAKARQVMWTALGLDGHSWIDEIFSGLTSNFSRELSAVLHGPLTQTPENLTLAYERSIPPGLALVTQEVAMLCDHRLYDGSLEPDQVVDRLRGVRMAERLLHAILHKAYGIYLMERRDLSVPNASMQDVLNRKNTVADIVALKKAAEESRIAGYSQQQADVTTSAQRIMTAIRTQVAQGRTLNPGSLTKLLRSQPWVKKVTLSAKDGYNIYVQECCHSASTFDGLLIQLIARACLLRFPNRNGQPYWPHDIPLTRILFDLPFPQRQQDGEYQVALLEALRKQATGAPLAEFIATYGAVPEKDRASVIDAMRVELGGAWSTPDHEIPALWHADINRDDEAETKAFVEETLSRTFEETLDTVCVLYASATDFAEHVAEDFTDILEAQGLTLKRYLEMSGKTLESLWSEKKRSESDHFRYRAARAGLIRRTAAPELNDLF